MNQKTARPARHFNPRAAAARIVAQVLTRSRYLDAALAQTLATSPASAARSQALVQELAYGVLRWYHELETVAALFLSKPLKEKDRDIHALLLTGLYQLRHLRLARHAAVAETVEAAVALKKPWAKDLLNACLRAYLRRQAHAEEAVAASVPASYSHPAWLIAAIRDDWPEDWQAILTANNERPPMVLRVNRRKLTREQYLARLAAAGIAAAAVPALPDAVRLEAPLAVAALPGFAQGEVSVQDAAAQFAAALLDVPSASRVLDACAAPGGKTAHLLECTPGLTELVALDRDPARVRLMQANLARLGLAATVITADATDPQAWWDGRQFDRILADVPCSASGVIRRHPDIKVRRQPQDLPKLLQTQTRILESLWPLLKPGGKLLYVTCSILSAENDEQMRAFLARHPEATAVGLPQSIGVARVVGRQILPGISGMDGFYYACLCKN
jgi:16S rRNA (cytosine967-C5)-methyltransferase